MNDHPMAKAAQLSPEEVKFRYDGLTSLFDLGLDFWWYRLLCQNFVHLLLYSCTILQTGSTEIFHTIRLHTHARMD